MWQEGTEGVIKLPGDDPHVFANHFQFIYTGALPIYEKLGKPKEDPKDVSGDDQERREAQHTNVVDAVTDEMYEMLSKLYVFATRSETRTGSTSYWPRSLN
jgi:hypothetical protein